MNRFRFGAYVIDTDARVLSRDGARVPLQAQPFELLRLLVERPGELVTREEIRARLWPDRVVAYDLSINYAVRQIRAALDEDAATILQTVPRRGYRFIAPVARVGVPAATRPGLARIDYRHLSAAAALVAAFASGFGAGILARQTDVGRFVYVHLVHPDRCPYIRPFLPTHRNS
jgi:DNA-binding winged helix-turn-helix (wHTH) protein